MPTFAFAGRTRAGELVNGERLADSVDAAVAMLRREQILVTKISAVKEKAKEDKSQQKFRARKVPSKNLAIFTRQFSVMIDAGLPLVQCLDILGRQEAAQGLRADDPGDPERGRRRRLAGRRDAAASEGVRHPLRQHGGGRRGGRYPRHDSQAPGHLHREERQAAGPGQGRDDLPDGGHDDCRPGRRRDSLEGHPDLRRAVRRPRRRAAAADPRRHLGQQLVRHGAAVHGRRRHRRHLRPPRLLRHLRRPPHHRPHPAAACRSSA